MAGLNRVSVATVSRTAACCNALGKLEMFFRFAKENQRIKV